jgi:hypothetical protein
MKDHRENRLTWGTGEDFQVVLDDAELAKIGSLCRLGASIDDMARILDLTPYQLEAAITNDERLQTIIKGFNSSRNVMVEQALYKRAIGFNFTERKAFSTKDGVEMIDIDRYIIPDTKACITWLKNMDPDNWKDTSEVNATLDTNSVESLGMMVLDELKQRRKNDSDA